ncbi:MAG: MazG nucleotide pyrophosphohydrolase domain-containing protein [Chloroflexota bacterium]
MSSQSGRHIEGDTEARTADDLLSVVERLRNPGGCPWDREQTHASLRANLLEEAYEALEALDAGDADSLAEEMGDLLVQIAFHADIARRGGEWTMADVVSRTVEKLVRRHPHVFSEDGNRLDTADQVADQWDALKRAEPGRESITDGLPSAMPALAYAAALQRRAGRAGIPLEPSGPPALPENDTDQEDREEAAGRVLFEAVRQIQALGVDPETALRAEALHFRDRIRRAEAQAGGAALADLSEEQRASLWQRAAQ